MTKTHKKPSPVQQKKLLTAHNRNEFFRRLEHLVTLISGNKETFRLIPQQALNSYFTCRIQSLRTESAAGHSVDPKVLSVIKSIAHAMLRSENVVVNEKGDMITLDEFLTVGLTLLLLTNRLEHSLAKNAASFVTTIESMLKDLDRPDSPLETCQKTLSSIAIFESNMASCFYWTNLVFGDGHQGIIPTIYVLVKVYSHVQKKTLFTIDGFTRPAVRVGWCNYPDGMIWCSCQSSALGLTQKDPEDRLPVYIQMHALQRLTERLDCVDPNIVTYFVFNSVNEEKIIKGMNEHYLIEFRYFGRKAGYLLAVINHGKLVIRTFLFLTNNGTPEGRKLHLLTGIQKHDKKFLSLDRLSTFMDPELRRNETIRRLFIDAGCGDLFEITKAHLYSTDQIASHVTVKTMMEYLMLHPVDAEAPPDFSDARLPG